MAARVEYFQEGNVHIIELAAPPKNPTDQLFFVEMAEIVSALQTSKDCSGVILRGRGRHFSSGADIGELIRNPEGISGLSVEESGFRSLAIYDGIARLEVPVVALVQGCCLGSGLELALSCHFRVACKSALFGMPETSFGLLPGCGGTCRLPATVGVAKSIEMILTGKNILAEDALKINLVDLIVEKSELMETAKKIIALGQRGAM